MREGMAAINLLLRTHPSAHVHFGQHASPAAFSAALSRPGWLVLEHASCWLMLDFDGSGSYELHWLCPHGADMAAIRRMLRRAFATGAESVWGRPSKNRAARMLARAIGCVRDGEYYTLSKARFLDYNAGKAGM